MKNRFNFLGVIVLVAIIGFSMAAIPAIAQNYIPETDLLFRRTEDNLGVIITGYKGNALPGNNTPVNIPPDIRGLPVVEIGEFAFLNKLFGANVIIPGSVATIGNSAFSDCFLRSVTISNGVTTIGSGAFAGNHLVNVTIPNSVVTIGAGAFRNNRLASITISANVTTIGDSAFNDNRLVSVIIPDSVTTIGASAFRNNQLTSITIGNDVNLGISTIGKQYDAMAFPGNFDRVYQEANRKAKTYNNIGGSWDEW